MYTSWNLEKSSNICTSGPAPLLLHLGGSTPAVMNLVVVEAVVIVDLADVNAPLVGALTLLHDVAEATIHPVKMIAVRETMIDVTVIVPEALTTGTVR